jgi:ATP-dependent RNA helicase DeaD
MQTDNPSNDSSINDPAIEPTDSPSVNTTTQPSNAPIEEPDNTLPAVSIDTVPAVLADAGRRVGWNSLMPVQAHAIPYILAGRDLMVQSRTGSGKTGAFILPMLDLLDASKNVTQALILVPTRELAMQVCREGENICAGTNLRATPVYGGVGYGPQLDAMRAGAHIVVGTPGRILDHLVRGSLKLDDLRLLVFDEADRLMSMGFYPDMCRVRSFIRKNQPNAYMFSATFPSTVQRLSAQFMRNPDFLNLSQDNMHVAEIAHEFYPVPAMDKDRALVRLIEVENPASAFIFCNTKTNVHYISTVLQRFGYDADELSSELAQLARQKVMQRVREGKLRFLVATDVAARGIDIDSLSHVFQYEVPDNPEDYIHRAGRTGRAGASGTAITLVAGIEQVELQRIAKRYHIAMTQKQIPSDEDVETLVSQRITALLEAKLRDLDNLHRERMQRFVPLAKTLGESDDELAVIAMLLDEYYQRILHTPQWEPEAKDEKPDREKAPERKRPDSSRPPRRRH